MDSVIRMITVAACKGCGKVEVIGGISLCQTWSAPHAKHRLPGGCPTQTNKVKVVAEKKAVNPLKASKKAAIGK